MSNTNVVTARKTDQNKMYKFSTSSFPDVFGGELRDILIVLPEGVIVKDAEKIKACKFDEKIGIIDRTENDTTEDVKRYEIYMKSSDNTDLNFGGSSEKQKRRRRRTHKKHH
jgi:hypothetical protein